MSRDSRYIKTIDLSRSFDEDPRELEVHFESEEALLTTFEGSDYTQVEIIGRGPRGPEGKSAYESWLAEGNVGTIEDFLGQLATDIDYDDLDGKPSIEGITLVGNKSFQELGVKGITRGEIKNIL